MIKKLILSLILLTTSCGENPQMDNTPQEATSYEKLADKYRLYLSKAVLPDKDCDALIFNSFNVIGGVDFDIMTHKDANTNQWFRRPDHTCWSNDESGSTISRDMLLGLMWYLFETKNLTEAKLLLKYAEDNDYIMGQGELSRTFFSPFILDTLQRMIIAMGGEVNMTPITPLWDRSLKGYRRYLNVLHIGLRGEILGYITDHDLSTLAYIALDEPDVPLFNYFYHKYRDGNQSDTVKLLLENDYWPIVMPRERNPYEHANQYFLFLAKKLLRRTLR